MLLVQCLQRYLLRYTMYSCSLLYTLCIIATSSAEAQSYDRLKVLGCTKYGTALATSQNYQNITDITTDAQGNVYIVGYGFQAETTSGSYMPTHSSNSAVFVAKFNPTLTTMLWGTYLGGSYAECSGSIAVNSAGEVLITGTTSSLNFPVSVASDQQFLSQSAACNFVAKFNSSGSSLLFCRILSRTAGTTYLSTASVNFGVTTAHGSVCATYDSNGDVIVASGCSTNFYTSTGAYQSTSAGSVDCSLSKLSSSGTLLYSSYVGGTGTDEARRVLCYGNTIYLSGRTNSPSFPLATNKAGDGSMDAFVMAWNNGANPTPIGTYVIGGSGPDDANGLCFNSQTNSVMVCGYSTSSNFPWTAQLLANAVSGGFVTSLTSNVSSLNYTTMIGASIKACQLAARNNGDFYVCASMLGSAAAIPISPTAIKNSTLFTQGVIIGASPDGQTLRYGSYFGGSFYESCCAMNLSEASSCGFRIALGFDQVTSKTDFPVSPGAYRQNTCNCYNTGIAVFGVAHPDTMTITPGTRCGEFQFSVSSSPTSSCALSGVVWSFGDATTLTTFSTSLSHIYQRNGTYHVTVRQIYGGTDTSYIDTTIVVKSQPVVTASPRTLYLCAKDTGAVVQASGASRYEWSPGTGLSDSASASPTIRPTKNMRYIVRGINPDGCYAEDTVQVYVVNVNAKLSPDTVICEGSKATLTASGASSYSWFPSSGLNKTSGTTVVASPTSTTQYHLIVLDASCRDTLHVTVGVSHAPRFSMSPDQIVCSGGSTQLGVTLLSQDSLDIAGLSYTWSPATSMTNATSAQPTVHPTVTTKYYCVLTNKYGCSRRDSMIVRVQNSLDLQVQEQQLCCRGGTIHLRASGGAMYSWSPALGLSDSSSATPDCTPQSDMDYTLITWSGDFATASCRDTAMVHVKVYDFPKVEANADTVVCKNTDVELRSVLKGDSHGSTLRYEWRSISDSLLESKNQIVVRPDKSTDYICIVLNDEGCSSRDTVHIKVAELLSVHVNAQSDVDAGTSFSLTVDQPAADVSYDWYNAAGQLLGSGASYTTKLDVATWFYVRAQRGSCEAWDSVYVQVVQYKKVRACAARTACVGDTVLLYVLDTKAQASYTWLDRSNNVSYSGDSVRMLARSSTMFCVTESFAQNTSSDSVQLTVYELPKVFLRDTTVCEGTSVELSVIDSVPGDIFAWYDQSGMLISNTRSVIITSAAQSLYHLTATNSHGCQSSAAMQLNVMSAAKLQFSIHGPDTLVVKSNPEFWVECIADHELSAVHLRSELLLPAAVLQSTQFQRKANDMVFLIDTVMNIGTQPTRIATLRGTVLLNQARSVSLRMEKVWSSLDAACSTLEQSNHICVIQQVCGSDLLHFEVHDQFLRVQPNPSSGDVRIESSDDIVLTDALGREISTSEMSHQLQDSTHVYSLHTLSSGMYFVRSRSTAMTQRLVVYR